MAKKSTDIVQLILDDHKPLKRLIKILKDTDKSLDERREAFDEFAPLLAVHAMSEENVLYPFMKQDKELRQEGFEGDVEHSVAEQLLGDIDGDTDEDLWTAKVKVLAELVEHHVKEEEDSMFPAFKKRAGETEREALGKQYLMMKETFSSEGEGMEFAVQASEESVQELH